MLDHSRDLIEGRTGSVYRVLKIVYGHPHLDLFAIVASIRLPLYVYQVPDPIAWKKDAF